MAKKDEQKRFETIYDDSGVVASIKIIVDKETGVNYLWRGEGYAGGLTPLLDAEGKPVVTPYKIK